MAKDEQLWPGKHLTREELRESLSRHSVISGNRPQELKPAGSWGIEKSTHKLTVREQLERTTVIDDPNDRYRGPFMKAGPKVARPTVRLYGQTSRLSSTIEAMRTSRKERVTRKVE